MESDVKVPDPWKKEKKDDGGVQHPQPFFSFNNKQFRFSFWYVLVGIGILLLMNSLIFRSFGQEERMISWGNQTGANRRRLLPGVFRNATGHAEPQCAATRATDHGVQGRSGE